MPYPVILLLFPDTSYRFSDLFRIVASFQRSTLSDVMVDRRPRLAFRDAPPGCNTPKIMEITVFYPVSTRQSAESRFV